MKADIIFHAYFPSRNNTIYFQEKITEITAGCYWFDRLQRIRFSSHAIFFRANILLTRLYFHMFSRVYYGGIVSENTAEK